MANEFRIKNGLIVDGDSTLRGNIYDVSGSTGASGQVLSSTSNGIKWNDINSILTLTSNTFNYIDFNTGYTATAKTGRVYYDTNEQALSYFPNTPGMDVTLNIGQESLIRVYNSTGVQINNGSVVHISGSTGGLPTVVLANASDDVRAEVAGVATHDIPNNSIGFITYFGFVRDVNTSAFNVGDELYLSDTIDGGFTNNVIGINFSSRVCSVGWVITSGTTNGKILVSITNENKVQSLTNKQVNILLGNTISTGVFEFTGLTKTSNTTFQIAPVRGWFVDNTSNPVIPYVLQVNYSGSTTGQTTPYLTTNDSTFVLMTSAGTISYQTSFPSPQERRQNIFLGKVVHPSRTSILNVNNTVDFDVSPMSALRDLWTPIKGVNQGIIVSPHSTTLEINTSAGVLWGNGIGWATNQLNPNSVSIPGKSPATFAYRTQTGGTTGEVSLIDVANYDVNGAVTPIPGTQYTTQRVYQFPTGLIRIQYGQNYYSTLAKALAALTTETFVEYVNNRDNGILIGLITVASNASNLSNTNQAIFTLVSKFGEVLTGTAGGFSTTTLQQAYDNSIQPEILTDSTLGAVTFRRGSAAETDNVFEVQNTSGVNTFAVTGQGNVSGNSFNVKTYIYDSTNTSGTTNQVLFTSPSGVRWNNIDGIVTGLTNNKVIELGTGIGSTLRINSNNLSSGNYSGVLSGTGNTASGIYSFVGSGILNNVSSACSNILGGSGNTVSNILSSAVGGGRNTVSGTYCGIAAIANTLVGGVGNTINTSFSGVTGINRVGYSFVGGGLSNSNLGTFSTISGGYLNRTCSVSTSVGGGCGNTSSARYSTVVGGHGNTASGNCAVTGGRLGVASQTGAVSFGVFNTASGTYSLVAGGRSSTASGYASAIAGGRQNTSVGTCSFVGGGFRNVSTANFTTVGGGCNNNASGLFSGVLGGLSGFTGAYSVVVGGKSNTASGTYSGILGGSGNTITNTNSYILGSNLTSSANNTTYVQALSKTSGTFRINHPDPTKTDSYYLYHSFVESPTAGDNIYRYTAITLNNEATIDLPSYYKYLNTNDQVWVNPVKHFGVAYGVVNDNQTQLNICSNYDGMYNILLIGTRKDVDATNGWQGVEVTK